MRILLALWLIFPQWNLTQTVTYMVTSTQNDAPALVYYQSAGDEIYDSLNWGNRDGDTLPWTRTVTADGTPYVRAEKRRDTLPWPDFTCSITIHGVVVATDSGEGFCMVRA